MTQTNNLVRLREALIEFYNVGELRTMCFDLSIDWESLEGDGKANKVRSLVEHAKNTNKINEITAYVRNTRPHVKLNLTESPTSPSAMGIGDEGGVTHVTHVYGDQVAGDKVGGDKVGGDKIDVGDVSDGSVVAAGQGASATMNVDINNKGDFDQQLQVLKSLLEQAMAEGDLEQSEGETAVSDLQDVIDESNKPTPRANRIKRRLEDVADVVGAAIKTGTAIIAAEPIVQELIQAVSRIFQ